ncbi:hypothetical protein LFREDSHE_30210 [Shewanella baltica]
MTHFTNQGNQKRKVAFAAPYPGTILAIDLAEYGGELICQKDSFLAAALGTRVTMKFNRRLGTGFLVAKGLFCKAYKAMA